MDTMKQENRYDGILAAHNREILQLTPAAPCLWHMAALWVEHHYTKGSYILELGAGDGYSTQAMLMHDFTYDAAFGKYHVLDISQEMLDRCKALNKGRESALTFICADAVKRLLVPPHEEYSVVFSSWMVHNFPWGEKRALFVAVHRALRRGGAFVLMDKVYPDNEHVANSMLDRQRGRYFRFLRDPEVAHAISQHELEDYTPAYRMDERPLLKTLREVGFSDVILIDRVERDVVIVCRK